VRRFSTVRRGPRKGKHDPVATELPAPVREAPLELDLPAEGRLRRADDVVAVHDAEVAVKPLRDARDARSVGPVYRRSGGSLAVPTGRVFVRLGEGESVRTRTSELEAAGFQVEEVPSYAPHAAWVRPASGRIADALGSLDRLRRLPGVEHVEPQLVGEVARK
jgi:hypothetical protein